MRLTQIASKVRKSIRVNVRAAFLTIGILRYTTETLSGVVVGKAVTHIETGSAVSIALTGQTIGHGDGADKAELTAGRYRIQIGIIVVAGGAVTAIYTGAAIGDDQHTGHARSSLFYVVVLALHAGVLVEAHKAVVDVVGAGAPDYLRAYIDGYKTSHAFGASCGVGALRAVVEGCVAEVTMPAISVGLITAVEALYVVAGETVLIIGYAALLAKGGTGQRLSLTQAVHTGSLLQNKHPSMKVEHN